MTSVKMEPADLLAILLSLSEREWTPALIESQKAFVQMAGVKDLSLLSKLRNSDMQRLRSPDKASGGDVFFRDKDMYYLVVTSGEPVIDSFGRPIFRSEEYPQPVLEIGIISPESSELEERLRLFASVVESAIKNNLDGRRTRHMTFEWSERKPGTPRLDKLTSEVERETGPNFSRASLNDKEVEAARILTNKLERDTLIDISQAGFARQRDILNGKPKQSSEIRATIATLKQAGLLNAEYLLECKRTSAPLTRLKDLGQLLLPEVGSLLCGACGAEFRAEVANEGYFLTELGRKLSRQSHWMTVWVTEMLTRAGVPESSILWNISESGEEVDLLVEFMGQLWIFELKDREFGSGDAHPLNYRQVRYRANNSIVVTTERVSKDAKRVFSDLAKESRRLGVTEPTYVEGLESAYETLRREMSKAALQYAVGRINILSAISGYDLGAVLKERFREALGNTL
jgi:hypothetical protein